MAAVTLALSLFHRGGGRGELHPLPPQRQECHDQWRDAAGGWRLPGLLTSHPVWDLVFPVRALGGGVCTAQSWTAHGRLTGADAMCCIVRLSSHVTDIER